MKVVFLDVDGVLNSRDDSLLYKATHSGKGSYLEVEDRALRLLKQVVQETGAQIVVSSSWRLGCPKLHPGSLPILYNKLVRRLADYGLEVLDVTPSLPKGIRGDEIRAWLRSNPVERFVILDDRDVEGFEDDPQFVQTTNQHGLTEELTKKAIDVLNS